MSTVPEHKDGSKHHHHHHRTSEPKGWKAIPKWVFVLGALCLAVLILIPVSKQQGWVGKKKEVVLPATDTGYVGGLSVSEVALDANTRKVKGVVTNSTDKTIDDVQVSYYVFARGGQETGFLGAKIPQVGPHQSAKFETDPMGPNGVEYVLREVTGTPR